MTEKSYTEKLVDSLRMEAETCRACAGHGGESSSDFFAAMALIGRKYEAAAAEIERLANYAKDAETVAVQHANTVIKHRELLRDCALHFKVLREEGVFVWPNHPLNPEVRIAEMLIS